MRPSSIRRTAERALRLLFQQCVEQLGVNALVFEGLYQDRHQALGASFRYQPRRVLTFPRRPLPLPCLAFAFEFQRDSLTSFALTPNSILI